MLASALGASQKLSLSILRRPTAYTTVYAQPCRSRCTQHMRSSSRQSVTTRVYSSPREREQSLPQHVRKFKTHRLAPCIADTPIQPFLQGSDDVDHLAASCWEICVAHRTTEELHSTELSTLSSEQDVDDGDEEAVFAQLEQAIAALLRLMIFCGLPSPWEGVNMLKMHPELVGLQDDMLVRRMVRLRALLPGEPAAIFHAHPLRNTLLSSSTEKARSEYLKLWGGGADADLPTLVRRKPGYLLDTDIDDSIQHALGVLKELMPHVNVQRQMSEEQQVWLTFASLVEGNRSGHTAQP